MNKGLLIVIEGMDGAGKSTLVRELCLKIDRPKAAFKEIEHNTDDNMTNLMMYSVDRYKMMNIIIDQLDKGAIIVLDRFIPSTYVYQGIIGGLELLFINPIIHWSTHGRKADITVYLKIDAVTAIERIENRESRTLSFDERLGLQYIEDAYELYFNTISKPTITLNAEDSIDSDVNKIFELIKDNK